MKMRRLFFTWLATFAIWLSMAAAGVAQVTSVQITGDPSQRIDILVLGDGYTSAEIPKFANDVNQFMDGVFAEQPWREYRNYFNVRRIDTASPESGADHPERNPPVSKNTAFDAAYNCSGIQRLVCVNQTKVNNAASVVSPFQRDMIIVIVNDPEYGGSGGSIAVASTNGAAVELILHETGHSFSFLADEYTDQPPVCSDQSEPPQLNATKETNRDAIKWKTWIAANTSIPTSSMTDGVPGLYVGARYCPTTLYRPTYNSKMRSLNRPYEQINTEQFVRRFYDYVPPIESSSPAGSTVILNQGQAQPFSVTTPQPATHALTVAWQLNGQSVAAGTNYVLPTTNLAPGIYNLTATASDPTPLVRVDSAGVLRDQVSWTITVSAGGPLPYDVPASGGNTFSTQNLGPLTVGHAIAQQSSGSQSGLAIMRYQTSGVTVSEAAVPASSTLTNGRIYAEVANPLDTGVAMSNPGTADVVVSFYFTNAAGSTTPMNSFVLRARSQIARFLDEEPFFAPQGFLGSFTFSASGPVAAIALRTLRNERGEALFTTLPVVDLAAPAPSGALVFPHFATGGGFTTSLLLVNSGDTQLSGTLVFRDPSAGTPLTVTVNGQTATSFPYSVAGRSAQRLSVAGASTLVSGSVLLTPAAAQSAPVGLVVFSYRPQSVTLSEAGVPPTPTSSSFLLYAEALGNFGSPNSVQPGIAVANTSPNPITVTLELRSMQGTILGQGSLEVPGNGQRSAFLNQLSGFSGVTGAAPPYSGRLRVTASSPSLTMMGLLGRYNERGDFLMTTTPPVPEAAVFPNLIVFPHYVDGEGFTTKFVFLNSQTSQASGTLTFYTQNGQIILPSLK